MKHCSKCNSNCDDSKIYCPNCGSLLESTPVPPEPPRPLPQKKSKAPVVLGLFLAGSIILNAVLLAAAIIVSDERDSAYELSRQYRSRYWEEEERANDLEDQYQALLKSYDFYDEFARVISESDSDTYHRYGCSKLDTSSFWMYNRDAAKDKASPCSYCCGDD